MHRSHRPIVLGLLAVGLALRLVFVYRLPPQQLYWDEPHYDVFGKLYASAWAHVGQPSALLSDLRTAFERTIWKGEAYSASIGLVYALVGPQPRAVFILQALADTLGCLFVYGIAVALGGGTVGIIALTLAVLYEPLIFTAARLQTETVSSCLFVGALWAIVWRRPRRETARHVLGGVLLAVAMLMRQALQYMYPVFLLMVGVVHWEASWRRRGRLALALSAGFFLVIGPRLLVTDLVFGRPIWGGARDPTINAYAGVVPENIGWQTDHLGFVNPPRDELREVVQARGATNASESDLRRAIVLTVWRRPIESAAVILHKSYQAWANPYNDSLWQFVTGLHAQRIWHRLIVVLAIIGLPLALRNAPVGVPLIAVTGYLWTMYLAVGIELRHAMPAMPLVLGFAALAVAALAAGVHAQWRAGQVGRWLIPVVPVCVLIGVLQAFPIGHLLEIAPTLTPATANQLRTGVMLLVILMGGTVTFALLRSTMGRRWALAATGPALVFGAAVFVIGRPMAIVWHRWTCPLADDRRVVGQEFMLPAELEPPQRAELRLDLIGSGAPGNDLVVTVNGVEARRFVAGPSRDEAVPWPRSYKEVFAAQDLPSRPWRGWFAVPVEPQSIAPGARLDVAVRLGTGSGRGVIKLVGDYPSDGDRIYDGPSPFAPQLFVDRSIYKYLNAGDGRMRRRVLLQGASHSGFFDGEGWSSSDLSPAPGVQSGRYRVLLLLYYPDGHAVAF